MTYRESLIETRDNYAEQRRQLSDPAKRKVSYSVGNRSVSWTEYQTQLNQWIKDIDASLASLDAAEGSATVVSAIC